MPNLEIHYKEGMQDRVNFKELGITCQEELSNAYNAINVSNAVHRNKVVEPTSVLIRFIQASRYDCDIPDICFVIKSGRKDLEKEWQLEFCKLFDTGKIRKMCCGLIYDIEMYNTPSHGFRKDSHNMIEFEF